MADVQHRYELRAMIEGLACRRAAEVGAKPAARLGPALIEAGRKAAAGRSVARMVAAHMRFHQFVNELSGNPLVAPAMAAHWTHTQRVMAEVLTRDETPRDIRDQHAAMLWAIVADDAPRAERPARQHIAQAADFMVARLRRQAAGARG